MTVNSHSPGRKWLKLRELCSKMHFLSTKTFCIKALAVLKLPPLHLTPASPRVPDSMTPWPPVYLCPSAPSPQPTESVENSFRTNYMGRASASLSLKKSFLPFNPSLFSFTLSPSFSLYSLVSSLLVLQLPDRGSPALLASQNTHRTSNTLM